jgi:methylated-DNA-[protein]-cysteine S-methyltransferase
MYYSMYVSPIGKITLASDGNVLIGLWNEDQKYHGNEMFKGMTRKDDLPVFVRTKKWLDRYFADERPSISELPLSPAGSEFRQAVWKILCEIPYGETVTYGDIAKKMAVKMNRAKMSSQAVGGAVGHNPISIIIPCHRVVGANGNLTGYAGGIAMKIKLLEHEGADMSQFFIPLKGTAV